MKRMFRVLSEPNFPSIPTMMIIVFLAALNQVNIFLAILTNVNILPLEGDTAVFASLGVLVCQRFSSQTRLSSDVILLRLGHERVALGRLVKRRVGSHVST